MDTNVNYTVVGAFVVLLVLALIFIIIWLSSGLHIQQYSYYLVYMQESVSGLSVDSAVEYNGVEVGKVKTIELNHRNPQLVEVLLSIKSNTPITRGTVATLNTKGLTGVAYMSLKDKSTDLRPLLRQHGQRFPVIPTAPSFFLRLDKALSSLSENIQSLSESMRGLLDKENLKSIREILANMNNITRSFAENTKKLDLILTNTATATKQFNPLLQSSVTTMRMIETQTLPTTYHLLSNLQEVVQTLSEVSAEIKQNPSILIRGVNPPPLGPGETK